MAWAALMNFGAWPVVSVRLITAPPMARRFSNISCRTGSSGCGSGGSLETCCSSSAADAGAVTNKASRIEQTILQLPIVRCMARLLAQVRLMWHRRSRLRPRTQRWPQRLVGVRHPQHTEIVEPMADDLQADRHAVGIVARAD